MMDVDSSSQQADSQSKSVEYVRWLVANCRRVCIQKSRLNPHNGHAMMTAPQTLLWLLLVVIAIIITTTIN